MIPADLAARMRMLAEASFFDSQPPIQGPAKAREIQARLPQLLPGQTFTANIQRALPDGTFQAAVAGRTYTLALNHAAKAGDSLELVVTRNTPKAVFAQLLEPGTNAQTVRPQLSQTGQLISFLLTGQPTPKPATMAEGKPLVSTPPLPGVPALPLASALRSALGQSGLFYESHQQQWLTGKLDLSTLSREPQTAANPRAAAPTHTPTATSPAPTSASPASPAPGAAAVSAQSAGARVSPAQPVMPQTDEAVSASRETSPVRALVIPERILPIVHQQLEGLATQQYALIGQAWPGQNFELVVHEQAEDESGNQGSDESADWQTSVRLTMPLLGEVSAQLSLNPAGVTIRLSAADDATRERLDAGKTRLADALEAAGLKLTGFVVDPAASPDNTAADTSFTPEPDLTPAQNPANRS